MAHIHDKIDYTVEVFVVYKNKLLMRKHDKYGIWLSVGGHVELDEDPNQAAIREVKEEVGLEVELYDTRTEDASDDIWNELVPPIALAWHFATHPTSSDHKHVTLVYFARAKSETVQVEYDDDRSDEWRWFTRDELASLELRHNIRVYAERALDTLGA